MSLQVLTTVIVGFTFAVYIGIAFWARANSTSEFYIAGKHVPPLANGMATAADWMSAASFISMAGLIAFLGYEGSMYLMGWTGGYVLLAMLLAPYLRKFGKFTVPEFIGERYDSDLARFVAALCLIFISFTYVAGQMRGVGIVFSRFLEVDIDVGLAVGMGIVFIYAVLGGMKGITYTQVAQYCVLIFAYTVPAVFISMQLTGNPVPQLALGSTMADGSGYLLVKLDQVLMDLGFNAYTHPFNDSSMINVLAITFALMAGTAGLPHVIVRFFTVPHVADARRSAAWALVFIALLYTVAPAVGGLARLNLITTVNGPDGTGTAYETMPDWFRTWEHSGLIAWYDHNHDGKVQHAAGRTFAGGKPVFDGDARGESGQRLVTNPGPGNVAEGAPFANEIYVDRDIMVLANPEIAGLPDWVIALIAAGGIAAALSTAAGLLLVISVAVSHDILKSTFAKNLSEQQELTAGRIAAAVSIGIAGYLGSNPPAFVAQVVAFAFGLAASSLFPIILLGIFSTRMNKWGAITGMLTGLIFTMSYILYFKGVFIAPMAENVPANWFLGISPEGIGTVGMLLNLCVALTVSQCTTPPPAKIRALVERIRLPET
ncbi:MAG: cation acetate symporter [Nitrospira sp. SB0677_bin_15]|nr:cation acetate symporter [Nitrospira sp. SB0661_bin_20]MYG40424.1 cation acetate symporter [Nitrospira sp. SB0677_bin_15]MYH02323.1 cation acetate symporter [Nitrospira sp. SB0675_bin_23]MYJ21809.1 cation acetate symporter [Nitrospira sp. SB0673_bin_12]